MSFLFLPEVQFYWLNCMICFDCVLNKVNYEIIKSNIAGDKISTLGQLIIRKRYLHL